jgi:uncharacterized membrane protein
VKPAIARAARPRRERWRRVLRYLLALAYFATGWLHLLQPRPFIAITPAWVPAPEQVIALTGVAEIVGAVALAQWRSPALRRGAGIAFALYAVCVFPANINHMLIDMAQPHPALGWAYHGPRMLLQPVLVWLALWTSGASDWPWQKNGEGSTPARNN